MSQSLCLTMFGVWYLYFIYQSLNFCFVFFPVNSPDLPLTLHLSIYVTYPLMLLMTICVFLFACCFWTIVYCLIKGLFLVM